MTDANIDRCQESQKIIVIIEFSTFKLFTMQNFVENSQPHSPFPFLKIAVIILSMSSSIYFDHKEFWKQMKTLSNAN